MKYLRFLNEGFICLLGIIFLNSCFLKNNYNTNSLKLSINKSFKQDSYTRNDSIELYLRGRQKELHGDTIDFFLNERFLFSRKMGSESNFIVSLEQAKFGENVIKANVKGNGVRRFHLNLTVLPENAPRHLDFKILDEFDHDPNDFTQGLIVDEDTIIESTGGYGSSVIKKYNVKTGELYKKFDLPKEYFGEGITRFQHQLFLLTYKENKILIFDPYNISHFEEKPFFSEGWGITNDNRQLIISNGSSNLYFLDPFSLEITRTLKVYDNKGEVTKINELEYINGEIYANIWFKDEIVIIDPFSGEVTKMLNFKELVKTYKKGILSENVLNGIAYDTDTGNIYITGKRWPVLFLIEIVEEKGL